MLENKDLQERYEAIKAMNFLVKNLNNEEAYYTAWIDVVPDEADDEELRDCAEDIEIFKWAVDRFRFIMQKYAKDGFYLGDDLY